MIINGVICDYIKCTKGQNGQACRIAWSPAAVSQDPEQMPDEYYKACNWQPNYEERSDLSQPQKVYNFCSRDCNWRFLRDLPDPYSPKELIQQDEINRQVEAKKKNSINGIPKTDGVIQVGEA